MSASESAAEKAGRLLLAGRVSILEVGPRLVRAKVRGETRTWECGYRPGGWWCTFPAFGRCSHLLALRRVVPAPLTVRSGPPAAEVTA